MYHANNNSIYNLINLNYSKKILLTNVNLINKINNLFYSKIAIKNSLIKTESKEKKKENFNKDVIKYLNQYNKNINIQLINSKYLVKSKKPKILYLVNEEVAENIATIIKPHIESNQAQIIECHPGFGILTSHLLRMKITNLHLHEPDANFYKQLLNLKKSRPPIGIYNNDILQVPKFKLAKEQFYEMLNYVERKDWNEDCIFQLIGSLNNQDFLRYILRNFTNQDGILSFGRPIMYLFITHATYKKLIAGPHNPWNLYKPLAVLFQIIFKIELLLKVDRKAFLPWPSQPVSTSNTESKAKNCLSKDDNQMYLIKLEGKLNLYEKLKHNNCRIKSLQMFVTHVIGRKKQRVIPTIEQWIPGFGPHLIAKDYNVYTLFNQLTPEEILNIYCLIHNTPGYEDFEIPTQQISEEYKEKIDTIIDLDIEEDDEEGEEHVETEGIHEPR